MADMGVIQGAISGLSTAANIAKGFLELKSVADVQSKVIELQSAILSAQTNALAAQGEQLELAQRVRDLEAELAQLKAWEEIKQQYDLHEPSAGTFVYALRDANAQGAKPHWICPNCFEQQRRSILQLKAKAATSDVYECPNCKNHFDVRDVRHRTPVRSAPRNWMGY